MHTNLFETDPASRADRRAFAAMLAVLALLCGCHLYYLLNSGMVPSWDEAQYMSGAHAIGNGLRQGDLGEAWHGWVAVVIKKPPLICLPAAGAVAVFGEGALPCFLTLVPIFAALVLSAYSLFRNALPPAAAAVAALLLGTMPLITGLVHRFYVENLLLTVLMAYLDVLLRKRDAGWGWTVVAGVLFGLGLLTKATFPYLALPPSAYLMYRSLRAAREAPDPGRERRLVFARAAVTGVIAVLIALTWYGRNWRRALAHYHQSFADAILGYSSWDATWAYVSNGPHFLIFCVAVAALVPLLIALWRSQLSSRQTEAWIVLLLVGGTVAGSVTLSLSKMLRLTIPALPTVAALAAAAPLLYLRSQTRAAGAGAAMVGVSVLLCLHNCFAILPLPAVRVGDLRILDSRFVLNVPNWYEDNLPLDRREYPIDRIVRTIADDAAKRPHPDDGYSVQITVNHLVFNDQLFHFAARGQPAGYSFWSEGMASDYIVQATGLAELHPGVMYADFAPTLSADVKAGKAPYEVLSRIPGPGGTEFVIYKRKRPAG